MITVFALIMFVVVGFTFYQLYSRATNPMSKAHKQQLRNGEYRAEWKALNDLDLRKPAAKQLVKNREKVAKDRETQRAAAMREINRTALGNLAPTPPKLTAAQKLDIADKLFKAKQEPVYERVYTKEQIELAILGIEAHLMELEDSYASVTADAEVTGDTTELRALDEKYGDLEEQLSKFRERLDNYDAESVAGFNATEKLIDDLGLNDYG